MPCWKPLPEAQENANTPQLFIKHDFQDANYSVYITDLTNIWVETLDRKSIIKRALKDDTSIDPSEGRDQLLLLLQHLKSALDCDEGTTLSLSAQKGSQTLTIIVMASLPSPLRPLEWEMSLKLTSQSQFATELLLPTLGALSSARLEVSSLLTQIKQRDIIIEKLLTKIEGSGVELASIFPGAVSAKGTKTTNRQLLFRTVPALKAFDEQHWRESLSKHSDEDQANGFRGLFKDGLETTSAAQPSQDRWWENLVGSITLKNMDDAPTTLSDQGDVPSPEPIEFEASNLSMILNFSNFS